MRILFDSKLPQFKSPFGTLTPNETCTLHIHVPTSVQATKVTMNLQYQDGTAAQSCEMTLLEKKGLYDIFRGEFSIPSSRALSFISSAKPSTVPPQ